MFPVQIFLFVGSLPPHSKTVVTTNALDDFDTNNRCIAWLGHQRSGNESRFIGP
jgi:hypothetical protein